MQPDYLKITEPVYELPAPALAECGDREPAAASAGQSARDPAGPRSGADDRLTIDRIVEAGYLSVPETDPVQAVIQDRHRVAGLGLEDCLAQLRHRYQLYESHMNTLGYTRQRAINAAKRWFDVADLLTKGLDPDLERTLRDLDAQVREERLSLWRDVGRLRQQMPEWVREYLASVRRSDRIRDLGGERS